MATRKKSMKHGDSMKDVLSERVTSSKKKSPPAFVRLDGLSQSAKDRRMNNRTVRPPKNLNLVEGDPDENSEFQRMSRQMKTFPNEHLLSSKIKEVNGMDFSNHFIEDYYRRMNSRSVSPEISEHSTNSSSITNDSVCSGFQEETCNSNISCSTGVGSSITESDLLADQGDTNCQEVNFEYNADSSDADKTNAFIRKSRYSKNAAIIGLIKNNIISLRDLELDSESKKICHSEDDVVDVECLLDKDEGTMKEKNYKDNSVGKCDSTSNKIAEYPNLVPHPEDPEFYTHPLQAYGKLDDSEIDFHLPRLGRKTVTTSRQYFIREGSKDDKFTFQRNTTNLSKPKIDFNFPNIKTSRSPRSKNYCDGESSNSYSSDINDENDGFSINHNEFPTLKS